MRSLWTGSIAFGLVNIPVRLFTAVKDSSLHFHLMSKNGQCRLHQKLYCPETGKEFDFSDTSKAYELAPGQYVLFNKEELNALKPERGYSIDIVDFIKQAEVDSIYYDRTYYLGPDKKAGKPYRLLLEVLKETKMVAIGRFVMRSKEYLALIRPWEDIMVLDTLFYADEVQSPKEVPGTQDELKRVKVTPKEKELGVKLVEKMVTHFDPTQYHDEYKEKVEELIEKKASGKQIALPKTEKRRSNVINLMDALKKSVEGNGKSKTKSKPDVFKTKRRKAA